MLIADKFLNTSLSDNIDDYPEGIVFPVDKSYRWTSADVIRKIKYAAIRHFGKKNLKVGHAGTLDPLATGVLLVCVGKATKRAEEFQKHDKEYIAGITFGATTPSYDLEKDIDRYYPFDGVSRESIEAVLPSFIGEQEQIAPLFSAKSIDGVRAYELARKEYKQGGDFDHSIGDILSKQKINISAAELLDFAPQGFGTCAAELPSDGRSARINVADISGLKQPQAIIRIACSKGTYVRSFARDLGEALGSGAFLHSLCRSASGDFRVENAMTVDEVLGLLL